MEAGCCSRLLLDSTYSTSNVRKNFTKMGRGEGLEAENFPNLWKSLIKDDVSEESIIDNVDRIFWRSCC